jgi:hypothetical protein
MSTQKRRDTYYSRIVVPSNLRRFVPRREVVKSLLVHTYSTARLRCVEWEARLYGLLETLKTRGQELSRREFDAELGKLAESQDRINHGAQYNTPPAHTTLIGASPALQPAGDLLSVEAAAEPDQEVSRSIDCGPHAADAPSHVIQHDHQLQSRLCLFILLVGCTQ